MHHVLCGLIAAVTTAAKEDVVRDTTVKRVTTRGGHNIPGQVAPGTPKNCRDCEIQLVPYRYGESAQEGSSVHRGHGFCSVCYFRRRSSGYGWDGPPPRPKTWKATELAAEYEFLRREHGLKRSQAATVLGVRPSALDSAVYRAKCYAERAERDRLRAEIALAEAEAHRINDDMIAYAIRKARAA